MAADPYLTHERAMERIGDLFPYSDVYEPGFFSRDPGTLLEHSGCLYDATWTLSADSVAVKTLRNY